jgi:hypothetical protein
MRKILTAERAGEYKPFIPAVNRLRKRLNTRQFSWAEEGKPSARFSSEIQTHDSFLIRLGPARSLFGAHLFFEAGGLWPSGMWSVSASQFSTRASI